MNKPSLDPKSSLVAYAAEVAQALVAAGHEPPERYEEGVVYDQRGFLKKKAVPVPFRRRVDAWWELRRIEEQHLLGFFGDGERHEVDAYVYVLRRDGTLAVTKESAVTRSRGQDKRSYGACGENLDWPDSDHPMREDAERASHFGYVSFAVWGCPVRRWPPYHGLGHALQALASSQGVSVPPPDW